MAKYTSSAYRDHLKLKSKDLGLQRKNHDGLLEAVQSRKPDYSKAAGRPEVGVSIQVGITTSEADPEEPKGAEDENMDDAVPCFIESPFDDEPY